MTFKHSPQARVTSPAAYGTKRSNPEMYEHFKEVVNIFELSEKAFPLYGYNADAFPTEFNALALKLGVMESQLDMIAWGATSVDVMDAFDCRAELLIEEDDYSIYMIDGVVILTGDDQPTMFFLK